MEQSGLLTQLETIKDNLQKITLMQQDYCKVAEETHGTNGADSTAETKSAPETATAA
jgi:hypothetical protein